MKKPIIILTGPTAVGKTKASIELAQKIGGEIISADSMQIYQKMDIGTAKITPEEMQGVPHHLVDILPVEESFHVYEFQQLAKKKSGKDLPKRTHSNRCRRDRILYSGTAL